MSRLTVGSLKQVIENIPDDCKVIIQSDSGVDQCDDDEYEVVVEDAYEYNDELVIYANFRKFAEEEDEN